MNINIKYSISSLLSSKYLAVILSVIVVIIIIFEVFTLKGALGQITEARTAVPEIKSSPTVRINFIAYDFVAKKIKHENDIAPTPELYINPFIPVR